MVKEQADLELIQMVRLGNRAAFSELVKRYQKLMLRLAMRFTKDLDVAQDVVQESFIKAYEKLESFEGRSAFKSWLFQIVVNTAKNKLREHSKEVTDLDDVDMAVQAEAENSLVHASVSGTLQDEIEKLPQKQKTALMLRVYEDLSFKEIAEIMDCPYDTAKANYRHALLKLRQVLHTNSELREWAMASGELRDDTILSGEVDA